MFGWFKKTTKTTGTGQNDLTTILEAHLSGDLDFAAKRYGEIFRKNPEESAAGFLLATVRLQLGDLAEGCELLGQLGDSGEVASKIAGSLKKVAGCELSLLDDLLLSIGAQLKQNRCTKQGLFYYRVTASADPESAEALYCLGDTLHDFRLYEEARQALSAAISVDPQHWGATYTYGVLLQDIGCDAEAIPYYQHAIQLRDDHAKSQNNLGSALLNTGHIHDALPHFTRAVELDPKFGYAYSNLGTVLNLQGKTNESLAAFENAATHGAPVGNSVKHALIQPAVVSTSAEIHEARNRMESELKTLTANRVKIVDPLREVGTTPFYLAYQGLNDLPLMRQLADFYTAACPQLGHTAVHCKETTAKAKDSRIRIGFASTFFYEHTIGRYFNQVIRKLSRDCFHVTAISTFTKSDPISRMIQQEADEVLTIPMNLTTAQQMIANAKLDVLIYCDIGMEPLTYFLGFARLAPTQIAFYGHPTTTGIPNIDYFLSHQDCETPDSAAHYSEKLLLLSPNVAYTYYERPKLESAPKSRADFSLDPTAHLYLCPQSVFKIHPDMDQLFAQILQADPNGQLLLFEGAHSHWNDLLSKRLAAVIPDFSKRVRFFPRMSHNDFLALLQISDVILDSLHFSGGATTLDALAMGTPTVTLPGPFMRGRQTLSCYKRLGIDDCVVSDLEEYVKKAVEIASNPQLRSELSQRILAAAPMLYEDSSMVREFETLILGIVKR